MKRTVTIAMAIGMLVLAGAAYAALNTYSGSSVGTPRAAGSTKKPVSIGFSEVLNAGNTTSGSRAAPLTDITTKIYGMRSNGGDFPTCSDKTIEKAPKFNGNCPKGSMIANGRVNSLLGGPDLTAKGTPCNPYLAVYNGGKGKQWYFFYTKSATDCSGLTTGSTAPYEGFVSTKGGYLVTDVPLPADISTQVAHQRNLFGSLIHQVLTFSKASTKVKGKSVGLNEAIGCKSGKRPYTITFTATNGAGTTEKSTVSGSNKC